MILQLNPQIYVDTPHGEGYAFCVIDYSPWMNSCFIVRLADGTIAHYDSNDITFMPNPTLGHE